MKLSTTSLIQILTVAASVASLIAGIVPPKYVATVAAVQGIISAVLHQIAGAHNPDGSPAYTTKTTADRKS